MTEIDAAALFRPTEKQRIFTVGGSPNDRIADLVFIHGIAGHPFLTWTHKEQVSKQAGPSENWFTWLSADLNGVRILTVGYPAARFAGPRKFASSLYDRSKMILHALVTAGVGEKPIVFISHSMGGILVKRILRTALESSDRSVNRLFDYTRGIVFFATPHGGSIYSSLARCLVPFWFVSDSLRELAANDAGLRELNEWMSSRLFQHCQFAQFYEQRSLFYPLPLVVAPHSAGPCYGPCLRINNPIDATHSDICRLTSSNDDTYKQVRDFIAGCIESNSEPPAQFLKTDLKSESSLVNSVNRESVWRSYMDTARLVERVESYLASSGPQFQNRCAIIASPSGYGKSTLARQLYLQQQNAVWFDPELSSRITSLRDHSLLVIDNLNDWTTWAEERRSEILRIIHMNPRVLVSTRSRAIADQVCASLGGQPRAFVFEIPAFTVETAEDFFRRYCPSPALLAAFSVADIRRLVEYAGGIPGIIVIAYDLMTSSPTQLRNILRASRDGDDAAFACAVLKEWLPKLLGPDPDLGARVLSLLASDISIFGLSTAAISALIRVDEDQIQGALDLVIKLGYVQHALPGIDATLLPHGILRSAVRAGALQKPTEADLKLWRRGLARLQPSNADTCLSDLTARLWATRESFVNLLNSRKILISDISAFFSTSRTVDQFLQHQFLDLSRVREALEQVIGQRAVEDCTVAVSLARYMGAMTPPAPVVGEAMWALTRHPDLMARCDAIVAVARHWRGYEVAQRRDCVTTVEQFVERSLKDVTPASGFLLGSSLAALITLGDEERAIHVLARYSDATRSNSADFLIAAGILALSLSAMKSDRQTALWREVIRVSCEDECISALVLYLCRGSATKHVRAEIDPDGALCKQLRLPVCADSTFRMHACGFYAGSDDFRRFVDRAVELGWIAISGVAE